MSDELTIIFERGESMWIATIPDIPGAVSQGETIEEAREMVIDCARELTEYRQSEASSFSAPRF